VVLGDTGRQRDEAWSVGEEHALSTRVAVQ
jgi:hypothetical protein